jgi:hypothetical protein
MSRWRIRVAIPDDPRSLALLTEALADKPVSRVHLAPRAIDSDGVASMTGEAVVELAHDDSLATMLGALHCISPQVFVSRADQDELRAPLSLLT